MNIVNLITRNIFPLIKSNYLKYFSANFKNFISYLLTIDSSFVKNLILYIIKTWPIRYPEKIVLYLEIIEIILLMHEKIEDELKKKIMKMISFCAINITFLVILF